MEITQEWITQFNKKCLDFTERRLEDMEFSYIEEMTNIECYREMTIQDLKFHSDWNWIMEVVEKIDSLKTETSKFSFHIYNTFVVISEDRNYVYEKGDGGRRTGPLHINNGKHQIFGKNRKEATLQAIDQFIDWYNKQKES